MDINRANELTEEVASAIDEAFVFQPWSAEKIAKGTAVREALASAVKVIVKNVPPCPDRTVAIRKARMDCNSAITFDGKL